MITQKQQEYLDAADYKIESAVARLCKKLRDKEASGEKLNPAQKMYLQVNEIETPDVTF